MVTYELLKKNTQKTIPKSSPTQTPIEPDREAIFNRHLRRCFLQVGDKIVFKKPRKNRITGTVINIEKDIDKVVWSGDGKIPFYISVTTERSVNGKRMVVEGVRTYESKLRKVG